MNRWMILSYVGFGMMFGGIGTIFTGFTANQAIVVSGSGILLFIYGLFEDKKLRNKQQNSTKVD